MALPGIYRGSVDTDTPRLVAQYLRADSVLSGFFRGIGHHEYEELRYWRPTPPYLAVIPDLFKDQKRSGKRITGFYPINVMAYLAPMPPVNPEVVSPPAAVVTAGGAGPLTGKYFYGLTNVAPDGESLILDTVGVTQLSEIDLASQEGSVAIPAAPDGITQRRLWRTEADRTRLQFHSVRGAGAETLADTVLDADLVPWSAPIRYHGKKLMSHIKRQLMANEDLREFGLAQADAVLSFADIKDGLNLDLGLRVLGVGATYGIYFDKADRTSKVDA